MVIEISLLFALGAMLAWGFGDFFIQRCTRKIGNVEALCFIGIIGSIGLLPFVVKDISLIFNFSNIILLLFLGILAFVIALTNFEALKKGKISVIDVILEFELPVTVILGFIFFKESLSSLQFVIISFIFLGTILIATKSFKHLKLRIEKGVYLALITAVGLGVINFLTGFSAREITPIIAVWFPWTLFSVFCLIYIGKREGFNRFIKNGIKFKWIVLAMGIFDTLAWVFYAFAVSQNEISITTAITESYPAIALFLGIKFNKEKIKWHQYLGAVLALVLSFVLVVV